MYLFPIFRENSPLSLSRSLSKLPTNDFFFHMVVSKFDSGISPTVSNSHPIPVTQMARQDSALPNYPVLESTKITGQCTLLLFLKFRHLTSAPCPCQPEILWWLHISERVPKSLRRDRHKIRAFWWCPIFLPPPLLKISPPPFKT